MGTYVCDVPLVLPPQMILVLENANLIVSPSFSSASSGVVITKSPFSGVVSPGTAPHLSLLLPLLLPVIIVIVIVIIVLSLNSP